jgi:hypothetical protein
MMPVCPRRLYYTPKLRQHDMALLTLGQPQLDIPPGKAAYLSATVLRFLVRDCWTLCHAGAVRMAGSCLSSGHITL